MKTADSQKKKCTKPWNLICAPGKQEACKTKNREAFFSVIKWFICDAIWYSETSAFECLAGNIR